MIKRVVIFGGHIQALGLARQVAAKGREVVLLVEDKYQIARYSRAVSKTVICGIEDWKTRIEELELPNKGTLLFPTNDEAVEFLCAHYEEYKERFALGVPEPEVIELFNNKRTAYRYAAAHDVPCPECWYPDTIGEVEALSGTLPYPVVVKPAIMYSFHATFGKKAFRCDSPEELMSVYKRIAAAEYPLESILIQEFLAGGPKHLYSYGVMAADGKPLAAIQANRIRQNPMDFGNSTTFAITCDVPEIEAQSVRLLAQTRYFGLGEVEWMWDEKCGQYKFLEVNTRAWKWHTLSNMLGFSFIGAMIDWFDGVIQKLPTITQNDLKENYIENQDKNIENIIVNQKSGDSVCCEQHDQSISADSVIVSELPLQNHPLSSDSVSIDTESSPYKNEDLQSSEKNTKNIYSTVGWVERLTDWAVVAKEIVHGRMKLGDVIKSYKIPHEYAVWRWSDPLPGIMYILLSPILYIKRH